MSINGKFEDITRKDLLSFADQNNIKDSTSVIDQICEAASRWPKMAKDCGVPVEMADAIQKNMLTNLKN